MTPSLLTVVCRVLAGGDYNSAVVDQRRRRRLVF